MRNYVHTLTIFILVSLLISCQKSVIDPGVDGSVYADKKSGRNSQNANITCVDYYYYYNDQQVSLGHALSNKIIVGFADGTTTAQKKDFVAQYAFLDSIACESTSGSADVTAVTLKPGLTCAQVQQLLVTLQQSALVRYANPYLRAASTGDTVGITNQFIVTLEPEATEANLEALARKTNTKVLGPLFGQTYVLSADKTAAGNAVEMANYFHETDVVSQAEPEFFQELMGW